MGAVASSCSALRRGELAASPTLHYLGRAPAGWDLDEQLRLYLATDEDANDGNADCSTRRLELVDLSIEALDPVPRGGHSTRKARRPGDLAKLGSHIVVEQGAPLQRMGSSPASLQTRRSGTCSDGSHGDKRGRRWRGAHAGELELRPLSLGCWWAQLALPPSGGGYGDTAGWLAASSEARGAPCTGRLQLRFGVRVTPAAAAAYVHSTRFEVR